MYEVVLKLNILFDSNTFEKVFVRHFKTAYTYVGVVSKKKKPNVFILNLHYIKIHMNILYPSVYYTKCIMYAH